ncbi:MAG TPA: hypothetical protein VHC63_09910 [Acidimicrobiales bacterium]|nr:hypothetical protein [Acidimicrobiales bacterium]
MAAGTLVLAGLVAVTIVGAANPATHVASRHPKHRTPAALDTPSTDAPDSGGPVTTDLPTTTTGVEHTTTTARVTTTDSVDDPSQTDLLDDGPPITPDPKIVQYALARKNSYPQHIVAGPDGALWFTESNTNAIGRITTTGDIKEFQLTAPFQTPVDIVVGPDNALWFTDANGTSVGRITTDGHVTAYPTGWESYSPMVVGPDGALWFSTSASVANPSTASHVIRLTPAGNVTAFAVGDYAIHDLVVGADGNIWGTETTGGLWRITPAGVATRFLADRGFTVSSGIAKGPDGRLWFGYGVPGGSQELGYLTPTGDFGHVALPANVGVWQMVFSPNGDLWFTTEDTKIVRMTPAGDFTTYDVERPCGITIGPDGNIWFTNDLGYSIGRIGIADA